MLEMEGEAEGCRFFCNELIIFAPGFSFFLPWQLAPPLHILARKGLVLCRRDYSNPPPHHLERKYSSCREREEEKITSHD